MVNQLKAPEKGDIIAVMDTSMGTVKIKLFSKEAPKAVENFATHAKNNYYNGLKFHRVISDFMIQGGDPNGNGTGGESIWGFPFEDEFDIDLRNYRGALSMANSGPNTNGSQFFIVQASSVPENLISQMEQLEDGGFPKEVTDSYKKIGGTPWLDFKHTVFGQVYEGMDIVDAIAAVPVNAADAPQTDVIINSIEVSQYEG